MLKFKLAAVILAAGVLCCNAAVKVPAVFSDHAVLAKRKNVPVWGSADPGETVKVSVAGKNAETKADKNGNWLVRLDLSASESGPFELKINDKVIKDVLVGEVWLASGQSNMAFFLKQAEGAKEEMAGSDIKFRFFNVTRVGTEHPQRDLKGKWVIANRKTSGDCSAVGYFFAKKLRNELQCPVGLINSSWGGSPIEAWMPPAAVHQVPEVIQEQKIKQAEADQYPLNVAKYLRELDAWEKKFNRSDREHQVPAAGWTKAVLTGKLFSGMGAGWLRYEVIANDKMLKSGMDIALNKQRERVELYLNGKLVKSNTPEDAVANRSVSVHLPGNMLKAGANEIAIRYFCSRKARHITQPIIINGKKLQNTEWEMFEEFSLPKLSKEALQSMPQIRGAEPRTFFFNSRVYNGMIYPLTQYAFSGVIWYQGESNNKKPEVYAQCFPAMITAWRQAFGNPELPFYFCQLANFKVKRRDPAEEGWARIRNAQLSALKLPHTAAAILSDCGEADDIHPLDKKTPGERLAAAALAKTYGKPLPCCGPAFKKMEISGNEVKILFENAGGGLEAKPLPEQYPVQKRTGKYAKLQRNSPDAQVEGFALCSASGKWHWADKAEIQGDSVIVSSKKISQPVRVRYNWSDNPSGNLYNKDGFPAVPFESK